MRKITCAHCGEKWHPTKGDLYGWENRHIELHDLNFPTYKEGMSDDDHIQKIDQFRKKHFPEEDSP